MLDYPIPMERLRYFQEKVGLSAAELELVAQHRQLFVERHRDFGLEFQRYFSQMPRTRLVLEHAAHGANLARVKADWFARLFSQDFDEKFLHYLWRSGLRHVDVSLDQRYVNLGYSLARQFCQQIVQQEVPAGKRQPLMTAVDKMLDFCVLVATDSLISVTSRCDRQVIEGIAHQVRNPVTVIGGNIMRLQSQVEQGSPAHRAYQMVLEESKRLERMVRDIGVYNELFQGEPQPKTISLPQALEEALQDLGATWDLKRFQLRLEPDAQGGMVHCDAHDLKIIIHYLLENCLEAADPADPRVVATTRASDLDGFEELELFNTGAPPSAEEMDSLFTPFHSGKPQGTGFGLPIANLAARRNLGSVSLAGGLHGGTLCIVRLPQAEPGGHD